MLVGKFCSPSNTCRYYGVAAMSVWYLYKCGQQDQPMIHPSIRMWSNQ
uniref:Uncharacterized protein n=1 Tax=Arundo donax TaxID=35708 RepID=A0A0A9HTJ9_ARUDO